MSTIDLDRLSAVAREDVPAEYSKVLGISVAPWGTDAIVLVATNEPPAVELEQVVCTLESAVGWVVVMSSGGLSDVVYLGDVRARPIGDANELPSDISSVVVVDRGEEHDVPVTDGYFLYAAWKKDTPGDSTTDPPTPEIVRLVRRAT